MSARQTDTGVMGLLRVFQRREPRHHGFSVLASVLTLVSSLRDDGMKTLSLMNLGTLSSLSWIISPSEINLVLGQSLVSCEFDSQI